FFFQAEDGIRDGHVTGVQTCALPISGRLGRGLQGRATARLSSRGGLQARQFGAALPQQVCGFVVLCFSRRRNWAALVEILAPYRSEERRVGKECRSRWLADHESERG